MTALLNWRVWAAALIAAALAFTHFTAYRSGKANVRAAWDAEKVVQLQNLKVANDENRKLESKRQSAVIAAQSAAVGRMADLRAGADRAGAERDRLRDAIRATGADLPSRAPDAVRQYATTSGQLLTECSAAYADVASKADGHASDSLMLQQAWPQN